MSAILQHSPGETTDVANAPFKVMVVDDSAVIRGFICRYLQDDPLIDVVTTAANGEIALSMMDKFDIEVVVLDIEMPVMDGLTALPQIVKKKPDIAVVMASTLTLRNAEVSLEALQKGAKDYVPKPDSARNVNASIDFRREIVEKVKAWAGRRRQKRGEALPGGEAAGATAGRAAARATTATPAGRGGDASGFVTARRPAATVTTISARREPVQATPAVASGGKVKLRIGGTTKKPHILAIGSSTGGPQALLKFFAGFKKKPDVPVVITQHMPAHFTAILGQHISQATGWVAGEAKDGEFLKPGQVYIAPGDWHLLFEKKGGDVVCRLDQGPAENFCRPAVDPMYRSLLDIYGDRILGVILTGMGHDGLKGGRGLVKAGANLLAQDEESSVVWGMPGAVATAGLCSEVLPIDELGAATARRLQGVL